MGNVIDIKQKEEQGSPIQQIDQIQPGDKQMLFTPEQWLSGAKNFMEAAPGIYRIIESLANDKKPGSGKEVASQFSINVAMAATAMAFVAKNFSDKVVLVLRVQDENGTKPS